MKSYQYLQYEPGAYPKDAEWNMMSMFERGVYHTLIVYLSCNGGGIPSDLPALANLCGIGEDKMQSFMDKYSHKFQFQGGCLTHSKVTDQIQRAKEFREARVKGGKARWDKS